MKVIQNREIEFIPASHENIADVGVWKKILLKHTDIISGRIQMINWAKLPVGKSFQNHFHEDMCEIFILVNGTAEAIVSSNTVQLGRGDCLVVEKGEEHLMRNLGDADVEYIVIGMTNSGSGKTVTVKK